MLINQQLHAEMYMYARLLSCSLGYTPKYVCAYIKFQETWKGEFISHCAWGQAPVAARFLMLQLDAGAPFIWVKLPIVDHCSHLTSFEIIQRSVIIMERK
jgi:hypothetical protein